MRKSITATVTTVKTTGKSHIHFHAQGEFRLTGCDYNLVFPLSQSHSRSVSFNEIEEILVSNKIAHNLSKMTKNQEQDYDTAHETVYEFTYNARETSEQLSGTSRPMTVAYVIAERLEAINAYLGEQKLQTFNSEALAALKCNRTGDPLGLRSLVTHIRGYFLYNDNGEQLGLILDSTNSNDVNVLKTDGTFTLTTISMNKAA